MCVRAYEAEYGKNNDRHKGGIRKEQEVEIARETGYKLKEQAISDNFIRIVQVPNIKTHIL